MEKYRKFLLFIILIPTPDFPHFYYMLSGNLELLLYGDVSVMRAAIKMPFLEYLMGMLCQSQVVSVPGVGDLCF